MLDQVIAQRSKGNPTIALTTKTKIMLKGVNPDKFHAGSEDDPAVVHRVRQIAAEMGVSL